MIISCFESFTKILILRYLPEIYGSKSKFLYVTRKLRRQKDVARVQTIDKRSRCRCLNQRAILIRWEKSVRCFLGASDFIPLQKKRSFNGSSYKYDESQYYAIILPLLLRAGLKTQIGYRTYQVLFCCLYSLCRPIFVLTARSVSFSGLPFSAALRQIEDHSLTGPASPGPLQWLR